MPDYIVYRTQKDEFRTSAGSPDEALQAAQKAGGQDWRETDDPEYQVVEVRERGE